jgi:DNA-directed RNA polymerase II subunit RPB2
MGDFDWDNDSWDVLKTFFDEVSLVDSKLSSFNDLIKNIIPDLIKKNSPIKIPCKYDSKINMYKTQYLIHIKNFYIHKPAIKENTSVTKILLPNEARLRNLTYNSQIYVDLVIEKTELKKILDNYEYNVTD